VGRLPHDGANDLGPRGGLETPVENIGIKIDFARPFDGAGFRVHSDGGEHLSTGADRLKDATLAEQTSEVDLFDRAVRERSRECAAH
jgi:hypothetical protein